MRISRLIAAKSQMIRAIKEGKDYDDALNESADNWELTQEECEWLEKQIPNLMIGV